MSQATLILTDVSGALLTEAVCTQFRFIKERYMPYTQLTAVFLADSAVFGEPAAAEFRLDGAAVHFGLIDTIRTEEQNGQILLKLTSRGFTSLLCQNQMAAGTVTDVTLRSLMESYAVPHVSYEDGIDATNYVWIKEGSTQWDAIVNYAYKYNQNHPYISGPNTVRVTVPENPVCHEISETELTAKGSVRDYRTLLSEIHMPDISGDPDAYSLVNSVAAERNIARHKRISLDLQYASDPPACLEQKIRFSMRGFSAEYGEYRGFRGEELEDLIRFGASGAAERIGKIELTGKPEGVKTRVWIYHDGYCNLSETAE